MFPNLTKGGEKGVLHYYWEAGRQFPKFYLTGKE